MHLEYWFFLSDPSHSTILHSTWDIVSSDQILEWTNKNIINEWIDYPITTSFFLFFFLPHIEKILSKNQTAVIEFIFTGFFFFICRKMNSYFYLLLLIYLFIITGTLMVFFFIKLDSHLHTPMYFLISVLSFLEIWYTTSIIHKILSNQVSEQKTIYLTNCLLNMYLFYSLVISEIYKLTTTAKDRYLAIFNPFYYPTIITPQPYTQLTVGCCFCGFLMSLPEIAWISTLLFCGPNQIQNIFCNFDLILNLTCMNTDRLF